MGWDNLLKELKLKQPWNLVPSPGVTKNTLPAWGLPCLCPYSAQQNHMSLPFGYSFADLFRIILFGIIFCDIPGKWHLGFSWWFIPKPTLGFSPYPWTQPAADTKFIKKLCSILFKFSMEIHGLLWCDCRKQGTHFCWETNCCGRTLAAS